MPKKKVTSKKTPAGYKVEVWVKDGAHVKPLLAVVDRYFDFVENINNPQRSLETRLESEEIVRKMKESEVIRCRE